MRKIGVFLCAGGLLALAGCSTSPQTQSTALAVSGVVGGSATMLTLNGQVLDLSSAKVTLNGEDASAAAVRAGMEISGSGIEDNGKVKVRDLEVRYRAQGQADQVDLAGKFVVVAGLKAFVTDKTLIFQENADGTETALTLADLAAGDYLKVAGIPRPQDPDDAILATRLERESEGDPSRVELMVPIRNLDQTAKTFSYGLKIYTVDYSKAEVRGTLVEGSIVRFKGAQSGTTITALRVRATQGKEKPGVPDGTRIELQGLVGNLNPTAQTFQVEGLTVDYSAATVIGTLANGIEVEVKGTLSGTTVKAIRVKVTTQDDEEPGNAELEGTIANFNATAKTFTVNGVTVSVNDQTVYQQDKVGGQSLVEENKGKHLTAQEFWGSDRTGQRVEVKGVPSSSTALLARKIELK
ncbi:DUF5666 domain-containing protein [Allomeiothermus silvanus]|uniref:DUF5666 domain-containing protein n=1 Tax=Allomeiothermus silvanus TaxID=52022 RepID=UPI0023F10FE8|nr:DUF5666 domain-containing protein [Allomeiothermus silvanus]